MLQRPDAAARYLGRSYAMLLLPVTATMLMVVWTVTNLSPLYDGSGTRCDDGDDNDTTASSSSWLAIALPITVFFLVGSIVAVTVVLLLYKYRCHGALLGMHAASLAVLFVPRAWMWLDLACTRFQLPYDAVTMTVLVGNVAAGAFVSILYYAPAALRQIYTVALAVLVAWTMLTLPGAVVWCLLLVMAVYDLFAVLSPCGPLRLLVNLVAQRGEAVPAFVYSSDNQRVTMVSHAVHGDTATAAVAASADPARTRVDKAVQCGLTRCRATAASSSSTDDVHAASPQEHETRATRPCGRMPIALGLGDFIFFSVLVGQASVYGVVTCGMCFIAVLAGMVGTLLLLLVCAGKLRGLPALPISIFAGVAVYAACRTAVVPLCAYTMATVVVL